MSKQKISLAYSTCPNDTFIFHALAQGLVDCGKLDFQIKLKDVETLNQDAKNNIFHISKLSFAAIGHLLDNYELLKTGAALGRGCGPLIITRSDTDQNKINSSKIAVPGLWTTANLLLSLYLSKKPDVAPMTFDKIMPAVQKGDFNFGVIIHEGRFTYEKYGLVCLQDLGQWWEDTTSLPIPLGGIAIRRDMLHLKHQVEKILKESIIFALKNRDASKQYIKKFAQEMDDRVIKEHIDLYVNDFTVDLGNKGKEAVDMLFRMAQKAGVF